MSPLYHWAGPFHSLLALGLGNCYNGSMPVSKPIVFVDFDGVLHPASCPERNLAMHANALAKVLLDNDALAVASTTWRLRRGLSALRASVGPALGALLIDKTPIYSELNLKALPDRLLAYQRHTECVAWMRKHHENPDAWLALDDRPYIFYPFCSNLVECDARTGLTGQTLDTLATRLQDMHRANHPAPCTPSFF